MIISSNSFISLGSAVVDHQGWVVIGSAVVFAPAPNIGRPTDKFRRTTPRPRSCRLSGLQSTVSPAAP
jgi:hypothetical protein